ncbi:MAG TPA: helix-turn-helix transcriptional regulator [Actinomycetes bacterium]|nr:helix-turn-helix transcriptional regulator [Actinomycetes bacterium]
MELQLQANTTTEDWEQALGRQARALRLRLGFTQRDLAERANVSLAALKNLESGRGSGVRTLVRVARALGREDWLADFAPAAAAVSPMQLLRARAGEHARERKRAPRSRSKPS